MRPDHPNYHSPLSILTKKPFASVALVLALCSNLVSADEPAPADQPAAGTMRKEVKLPGLVINLEERCVDVESAVCLDEGTLELIACTKDSKEHESIVTVGAKAMHIHTALLLLGAKSGNPAMRKRAEEDDPNRWIDVPPKGGPVDVYLVLQDKDGKLAERPISDFITRSRDSDEALTDSDKRAKFPTHTFLFAGSHLVGDGPGPRKYLSDVSGNVISIATFGDELLCLPEVHSHENGSLLWEIDATDLPAVGSKVTLRLRPQQLKPAAKTSAAETKPKPKPKLK